MTKRNLKRINIGILAGACLLGAVGGAFASPADHGILLDGSLFGTKKYIKEWELETGSDARAKEVFAGEPYELEWLYSGNYEGCTRVSNWKLYRNNINIKSVYGSGIDKWKIQESIPGDYRIELTTEGYNSRFWFFGWHGCDNRSEGKVTTTAKFKINEEGYTQTRYPIMLVPGVIGYDEIAIAGHEYFYGIADAVMSSSGGQEVVDVSLDPWLNTEDRGAQLADRIIDYLIVHDPNFHSAENNDVMKVNLIAHSHGSTTSRMAIRILSELFSGLPSKVASLTTVAGPHYGTPTADGAQWILDNYDAGNGNFEEDGLTFMNTLLAILGEGGTFALNFASGHAYPLDGIKDTVAGFTQRGMARFNMCYPSAGLPNRETTNYFIETSLPGKQHILENPDRWDSVSVDYSSDGLSAQVTANACQEFAYNPVYEPVPGFNQFIKNFSRSGSSYSKTAVVNLTDTPNYAYGYELDPSSIFSPTSAVYGDGLGNVANAGDANAIRYFSFTGATDTNADGYVQRHWKTTNVNDVADEVISLFEAAFRVVGARTTQADFELWYDSWVASVKYGMPNDLTGVRDHEFDITTGYQESSDAFIPVNSTRFGQYINTYGPWNHMDEQNGLFGAVSKNLGDHDPVEVYREHVNRLKRSGL